jgi:hypothetical protein
MATSGEKRRGLRAFRHGLAAAVALGALALSAAPSAAVSGRVETACKDDYFKFCPAYSVGTPQLRACMRQVGRRLSPRCIDALVDSGEISRKSLRK